MSLFNVPFIGCLVLTLIFAAPAVADVTGKARVVDGDTIHIGETKIRFHGIDAPEQKQTCTAEGKEWACGQAATKALNAVIDGHKVTCKGNKRDRYKRLLAVCYVGSVNLNAMMVRNGWALAYRKYSTDYVDAEASAKKDGMGLWGGQFVAPWKWRRGKHQTSEIQKFCCKICRKGKACGNSCIRSTYTCRKQQGCACNAN